MEELDGKVAVITGGGSGIGRASAIALAGAGVHVVVSDIDAQRCDDVASEINTAGGRAVGQACDVTSDVDVASLRDRVLSEFGGVDIVMNNVGVLAFGRPENIPIDAWQRIVDTNLLAIARSISVFLPGLLAQGSGHFINTASTAGLYGYSFERLPYSATKGAVVALTEALALYCIPQGVGVTLLCPGPVATNIAEQMEVFGEIGPIQAPGLEMLDPSLVGDQVLDAIRKDIFFVPTHPEVHEILIEKARDPEGFLKRRIELMGSADPSKE